MIITIPPIWMINKLTFQKPSLISRAIATLVRQWPSFRDGEYLANQIRSSGLNISSYGNFSALVEGSNNKIIKVFDLKDIGYRNMLDIIITHDSKFLPKVFSTSSSGRYGIVEMEKLISNTRSAVRIANYIDQMKSDIANKSTLSDQFTDLILKLNQRKSEYNSHHSNKITWDVHEGNIMFRDKTPVLIDMFFCEESDI